MAVSGSSTNKNDVIVGTSTTEDSIDAGNGNDIIDGDTLTYSATLADGSALPSWLTFNETTRTFSGTPPQGDDGAIEVMVTGIDPYGLSAVDLWALSF